ncbi:hypothetical protein M501DRAFT_926145 [Patellaria atrata CBS 101060]|uniref:Nonsense-mediated mRNA decay factor n=1 Tax=Patellaria atrata CBS 101060 TaxID=1346257 RepID=A0A9P4SLH1_9PEZI|nr:hypothetical protein M501DRAFT_926145 [Patellaria atrata CBS 101060]
MFESLLINSRLARSLEKKFSTKLADREPSISEILIILQDYRAVCQDLLLRDFLYATQRGIENELWAVHSKLNTRFRKQIYALQKAGKSRTVELRNVNKQFVGFIKLSQRFYRDYIFQLDTHYDGIPELHKAANKCGHIGTQHKGPGAPHTPELTHRLLLSCYQTLIYLGDLSRYRETETGGKEQNWGPAVGYYGLATEIYPQSGMAHNQQAVIALADGNHLRATYHLYRSLSTKEPHPLALKNLEIEFKKIVSAWDKGELINNRRGGEGNVPGKALIAWFVRLHSKCYKGEDFNGHDELENEVLSQLALELKERSLEGTLQKFVLINIAAEYFASVKLQQGNQSPAAFGAYFYFLRLNVKTLFTLLQILQPELEKITSEGLESEQVNSSRLSDKVTTVARRVLPGLRLYSVWLFVNRAVLSTDLNESVSRIDIQELWKSYANTLTMIASAFPAEDLPDAGYLLEEDVDTIAFEPLMSEDFTKHVWFSNGKLKPKWSDADVERYHPNEEMLIRIRGILLDGLQLAVNEESVPITLDGLRFLYQEAGIPSELLASPRNHENLPTPTLEEVDARRTLEIPNCEDQISHGVAPSDSTSIALAKDVEMNQMVNDLVGDSLDPLPEIDEDTSFHLMEGEENIPSTPPEQTFDDTAIFGDNSFGIRPLEPDSCLGMIRKHSQQSQRPPHYVNRNSQSSPAIRTVPALPLMPDQSNIWNPTTSGSTTPFPPPGLGHRMYSPVTPQTGGLSHDHSRVHSRDSMNVSSPSLATWSSYIVTPIQSISENYLGQQALQNMNTHSHGHSYGQIGRRDPIQNSTVNLGIDGSSIASPIPLSNPRSWNMDLEHSRSSYGGPPNGQVG